MENIRSRYNKFWVLCALAGLISACGSGSGDDMSASEMNVGNAKNVEGYSSADVAGGTGDVHFAEAYRGVTYKMSCMSGLDFVLGKGENPGEKYREELERETVVFLEFTHNEQGKDLLELPQMQLSKDDAMSYLAGSISSDIKLMNGEDELSPEGVLFEGTTTGANKVRVIFFFGEVQKEEKIKLEYYDRLFGAGLIKLTNKIK